MSIGAFAFDWAASYDLVVVGLENLLQRQAADIEWHVYRSLDAQTTVERWVQRDLFTVRGAVNGRSREITVSKAFLRDAPGAVVEYIITAVRYDVKSPRGLNKNV